MPNVYGRLPRTEDGRDYLARTARPYTGAYVTLEDGFSPIRDQGQLGACVAFGTCAAAEYAWIKAGQGVADDLSELFVYYAARARAGYPTDQDTGLQIRDGFASLAHDGAPPEGDWPYDTSRFMIKPPSLAYDDAALDEALVYGAVADGAVDDMIASGWPPVIGFDVYESFEYPRVAETGVMPVPAAREQQVGGHCVVLISTPRDGATIPGGVAGIQYRRARNSWGPDWGDHGYFWYPLPAMVHASDFWQVTTVGSPLPPVPPGPGPAPGPDGPSAEAVAFAKVLHGARDWVNSHHYGYAGQVARAARPWLKSEGL